MSASGQYSFLDMSAILRHFSTLVNKILIFISHHVSTMIWNNLLFVFHRVIPMVTKIFFIRCHESKEELFDLFLNVLVQSVGRFLFVSHYHDNRHNESSMQVQTSARNDFQNALGDSQNCSIVS